jgi:2-dehydro-3-deoxyphosphooctonate aldolase (KDO 8-P synthase)
MKAIDLKGLAIGGGAPAFFILGPCVIEGEAQTLRAVEGIKKVTDSLGAGFVFKSSYDKANRTSAASYRGPGLKEGLRILRKAREEFSVAILTDVHCVHEVAEAAEVADIIQVPAFLSRQTDLIVEAARRAAVVNIKKGQFMAPSDVLHSADKAVTAGNERVMITERGVSFGYNNLVVDFRSLPVIRGAGYPVVFDATHSVQAPGGLGASSGGDRAMARHLARAACAVGVDGVFMEVHPEPEAALCDGPNSIALGDLKGIIEELMAIDGLAKGFDAPGGGRA